MDTRVWLYCITCLSVCGWYIEMNILVFLSCWPTLQNNLELNCVPLSESSAFGSWYLQTCCSENDCVTSKERMLLNRTSRTTLVLWSMITIIYWKPRWYLESGSRKATATEYCGSNAGYNCRGQTCFCKRVQSFAQYTNSKTVKVWHQLPCMAIRWSAVEWNALLWRKVVLLTFGGKPVYIACPGDCVLQRSVEVQVTLDVGSIAVYLWLHRSLSSDHGFSC